MSNHHRLTEEEKISVHAEIRNGNTLRGASRKLGIPLSTIFYLQHRWRTRKSIINFKSKGRLEKIKRAEERRILRLVRENPYITIPQILQKTNIKVTHPTLIRRLHKLGYWKDSVRIKPNLTQSHIEARVAFAEKYYNSRVTDWAKVLWTDESTIVLGLLP